MKSQMEMLTYHSSQSSHPFAWQDIMTKSRRLIEDAVEQMDFTMLESLFSSMYQEPLLNSLEKEFENLDVIKLSYASIFSSCTDKCEFHGVPKEQLAECRHRFFLSCSTCVSFREISELFHASLKELIHITKNFFSDRYSYHVTRAICYIFRKRYQPLSSCQIADFLRLNRTYLARIFKAETGLTLSQYIRLVKIRRAVELMTTRLYHLTDIAEMLGYKDYSHFCSSFKKIYGISPRQWIREH